MQPTTNPMCNMVYHGNGADIGDLPCERRQPGEIHAYYEPGPHEAHMLPAGWVVDLGIYAEPIPPVSVAIVKGPEPDGDIVEGAIDRRHLERAVGYLHGLLADCGYEGDAQQLRAEVGHALALTRTPVKSYQVAPPRELPG